MRLCRTQDEEAALLAELERIKKERAEEARKKARALDHAAYMLGLLTCLQAFIIIIIIILIIVTRRT